MRFGGLAMLRSRLVRAIILTFSVLCSISFVFGAPRPVTASPDADALTPPAATLASDPDTLAAVVATVRQMRADGQSRLAISTWLTGVVDRRVVNMNSIEKMTAPGSWIPWPFRGYTPDARLDAWRCQNIFQYDKVANWTWTNGIGQCSEHACTVFYILKEAGVDGEIRIFNSGGHEFAVWGLAPGYKPEDANTWGRDAYVLDSWLGKAMDSREAVKEYYISNNGKNPISDQTQGFVPGGRGSTPKVCSADTRLPGGGDYWIFVLTNASNGLYIGTEASLKGVTRCSFEGGGIGCKAADVVTYRKLLGPFPSAEKAQAGLTSRLTNCYVYPLGIGLMGEYNGGTRYGLWHRSVSGTCPKKP
jgi:hypothetical protein